MGLKIAAELQCRLTTRQLIYTEARSVGIAATPANTACCRRQSVKEYIYRSTASL